MNEMTTFDVIVQLFVLAVVITVPGWMVLSIIRRIIRSRREKHEASQRIHDAMAKIMADGKIEGPTGEYKPKRWAKRWVEYANSLPMPRRRYEMSGGELPRLGRKER